MGGANRGREETKMGFLSSKLRLKYVTGYSWQYWVLDIAGTYIPIRIPPTSPHLLPPTHLSTDAVHLHECAGALLLAVSLRLLPFLQAVQSAVQQGKVNPLNLVQQQKVKTMMRSSHVTTM